jgi:hypothetical protein
MKRLYTYTDFIQKTTNENVNHFDESNRDFVLNEMQPSWTPEETKSMYEITKENIYQKLKDKFFQRIDIILTRDEDLFSSSKSGAFGSYYDSKMAEKINKDYKLTYKEISDKIKKVWNDKILSRLIFTSDLQSAYNTLKNSKRNDLFSDSFKNSYDIVEGAYGTTWGNSTEGMKVLDTILWQESDFYKTKTDSIFSASEINSDTEYTDLLKKLSLNPDDETKEFRFKNLDSKLKSEFFEYYRHYHFWLFANLIMSGKKITTTTTTTNSGTKSSSTSTGSARRERINVDRNAVGERFSGL